MWPSLSRFEIHRLLQDPQDCIRRDAMELLVRWEVKEATAGILRLVSDPDPLDDAFDALKAAGLRVDVEEGAELQETSEVVPPKRGMTLLQALEWTWPRVIVEEDRLRAVDAETERHFWRTWARARP